MIRIAVVIPFYNSHETILETIQSIDSQVGLGVDFEFDIIIVDDGSTMLEAIPIPDTRKGCVVRIFKKENGGASSARNYAIGMLDSVDYLAFLDADDMWAREKTALMIAEMRDNAFAMLGAFSNTHKFFTSNVKTAVPISFLRQLARNHFLTSSVIIDFRKVDKEEIYFPKGQSHAEEGDLFLRIAKRYRVGVLALELVDYSNGKAGYGMSGLSADVHRMQYGEVLNYIRCLKRGDISIVRFVPLLSFSMVKYLRRILIKAYYSTKRKLR